MPGYVIHLAIAKKHLEQNNIQNEEEFIRGIIAPDLLKQSGIDSHYGVSSSPDIKKFFEKHSLKTDYNKGYFLHLVTDYLFYNKFLSVWSPQIYDDYNVLNKDLIERYQIQVPKEIEKHIKFADNPLTILSKNDIISFIETVGKIPIDEMYKKYVGEKVYESQK